MESNLVSVEWLNKHLNDEHLIILDASMPKATSEVSNEEITKLIPNSIFFDIKNKFSDTAAQFPNTIPSEQQFEKEARLLGIHQHSKIVVYDNLGIYSSPRVWWLFRTFGFSNIFVLDGGLPEWIKQNFTTVSNYSSVEKGGNFKAVYQPHKNVFIESLDAIANDSKCTIIDARSSERFKSEVPEPRKGLRSGNIPNSLNLPYELVLKEGFLKSIEELQAIFKKLTQNHNLIFTCGSGITASILDFAASEAGYKTTSVYDGSWTEYGTLISEK